MKDNDDQFPNNMEENTFLEKVSLNNFRIRSEDAQEVISRKPTFFERWSIIIILISFIVLILATWFIRYPDVIQARATLFAKNAPKPIVPLKAGRLVKLEHQNGDTVKQGQIIGIIESSSNAGQILALSSEVDSCSKWLLHGDYANIASLFNSKYYKLGSLQLPYQNFIVALQEFSDYHINGYFDRQRALISSDIKAIDEMNDALRKQKKLTIKDNLLSEQSFRMNEELFKEKVISADEYRQQESKLVNKQMAIPQTEASILSNQNIKRERLKAFEELNHTAIQQKVIFRQVLQNLKSSIDEWRNQYLLIAPTDGIIIFNHIVQQNDFVESNRQFGLVSPPNNEYFVQLHLPQINLGKIDTGMVVQLRFDAYPYEQSGIVVGRITYISKVGDDSEFLAFARLDNGLNTSINNTIKYKEGLMADAVIITKNMRLLQRFYYNIIKNVNFNK